MGLEKRVRRFVLHGGLEAGVAADVSYPGTGHHVRRVHRPGSLGQIGELCRGAPRTLRGHQQHQVVKVEVGLVDVRVHRFRNAGVFLAHNQVELPVAQPFVRGGDFPLDELDPQFRELMREHGERRRGQHRHCRLERGHPQGARHPILGGFEFGFSLFQSAQHRLRVGHQGQCPVGEPHRAPDAFQELCAGLFLQQGELLRDRRRRVVQRLGNGGQGAAMMQLVKNPQSVHV